MKLLTINQVADMLSLNVKTIYHLKFKKLIPFTKVNGALRFDSEKIQAWLEANSSDAIPKQPKSASRKRGRPRKSGLSSERIDKIVEQAKAEAGV